MRKKPEICVKAAFNATFSNDEEKYKRRNFQNIQIKSFSFASINELIFARCHGLEVNSKKQTQLMNITTTKQKKLITKRIA
jgi:hypothetical protein